MVLRPQVFLEQPTLDHQLRHQRPVLASCALPEMPCLGEVVREVIRHARRVMHHVPRPPDTCHGCRGGSEPQVALPSPPAASGGSRLSVHRRLLVDGRAGETLRVRLPPVFLRPLHPLCLLFQPGRMETAVGLLPARLGEEVGTGEGSKEKEY